MKQLKYFRKCPKCDKEIGYANNRSFNTATMKQQQCMSCAQTKNISLVRNCPQCNKILTYTLKCNRQSAEKNKNVCWDCSAKNKDINGENNPFYGKLHTNETKRKLSHFASEVRIFSEKEKEQAKNQLAKVSNRRPAYDLWLEKYGKEEADLRLIKLKKKHSVNSSGSKNGMYGKISPEGSGNGWSGWYKNWYFRSIRELSYMIKVLEKEQLSWKIPDKSFNILYIDFAGQQRTYFPDFIVSNKIIEIKPFRLFNTPKVLAKRKAAEEFCQKLNMVYEIIDPPLLSNEEIKSLYINCEIIFIKNYDDKFKEKFLHS